MHSMGKKKIKNLIAAALISAWIKTFISDKVYPLLSAIYD